MKNVVDKLSLLERRMEIFERQVTSIKEQQEKQALEINEINRKFEEHDNNLTTNIIYEVTERHKRRNNIIIRGLAESVGSIQERMESDRQLVQEVLSEMKIHEAPIASISRVGKTNGDGSRLMKVVLPTETLRQECIQKSRILRNTRFREVFVHPDRTPSEQKADQDQRRKLKAMRDAGQDVVIYRGEIRLRGDLGFRQ